MRITSVDLSQCESPRRMQTTVATVTSDTMHKMMSQEVDNIFASNYLEVGLFGDTTLDVYCSEN